LFESKAQKDEKYSKAKLDIHLTYICLIAKHRLRLVLCCMGHKERGPGGFKPKPHKRRRRALKSHSKEGI